MCRTYGAPDFILRIVPGLPAWANLCRAYGAGCELRVTTAQMAITVRERLRRNPPFRRMRFQRWRARQASPRAFWCRTLRFDESGGKPPHSQMGLGLLCWAGVCDGYFVDAAEI